MKSGGNHEAVRGAGAAGPFILCSEECNAAARWRPRQASKRTQAHKLLRRIHSGKHVVDVDEQIARNAKLFVNSLRRLLTTQQDIRSFRVASVPRQGRHRHQLQLQQQQQL